MSTWQAELGSTEEGAIKKANQRREAGINEQKSHFPLKHSKKIIMPKYQFGVHQRSNTSSTNQLGDWRLHESQTGQNR